MASVIRRNAKTNGSLTFGDLAERWLEDWSRHHCRSHGANASRLRCHIIPLIGDMTPDGLTEYELDRLAGKFLNRGLSAKSVNNCLLLVSSILNRSSRWKLITKRTVRCQLLSVPEPPISVLSEDELRAVFKAAEIEYKGIFEFIYLTGRRKREVLDLTAEQVDFHGKAIRLTASKSLRLVSVPLIEPAMEIIQERYGSANPWIFPSPRTGMPYADIRKPWRRALREARIEKPYTIHHLRHSCASHLLFKTGDLRLVQQMLGHRSIQTTTRYARLNIEWMREKMEVLSLGL
ncbi:MAG: site-specific integrase [Candidatus Eisenbacteria bacterium]|uniref:Site-specific integrase n=1 Tax=Eiseniibacteriota bacterium TaxID=2212470 RepID=A0A948W7P6_UNCEI|nr:site-specific integrase [Candidatus Eisenbacteria bacterium]MBU1949178.1 site-specific integrase [Candidatus Eisenbacteria bacterium]MBU2691856.1 site-specific integrase [Candidatus Eisenbacteria bacterium]